MGVCSPSSASPSYRSGNGARHVIECSTSRTYSWRLPGLHELNQHCDLAAGRYVANLDLHDVFGLIPQLAICSHVTSLQRLFVLLLSLLLLLNNSNHLVILERCLKICHTCRWLNGKHILHLQQHIQGVLILLAESNLSDATNYEYSVVHMFEWHCHGIGLQILDSVATGLQRLPVEFQHQAPHQFCLSIGLFGFHLLIYSLRWDVTI